MKKKLVSIMLCSAMVMSLVAGCGSSDSGSSSGDGSTSAGESVASGEEGDVLNIYVWNEEFKSRVEDHYPGYEKVSGKEGKIGDVTVKWNTTPSDDNAYQNNLDENLLKQADAAAKDKIDLFLIESDYAVKYINSEYSMPLVDLGITDAELANQYQYTKDIATDSDGNLKGISWQGCPGVLIYNREIAKDVLGTDDPAEVQKSLSDWDKFADTAKKMKDKGYHMTSSVNDTYRVFSNNVTSPWVVDGKINIDENINKWIELSKKMVDEGQTDTYELWGDDWSKGFFEGGKVFCYFGPAWFVDFCMKADTDGSIAKAGGWGATEGPQGFFWGGTWICAATGTDNPTLVKDIMEKLTTDETIMTDIVKADNDFVNNKPAMEKMAESDYKSEVLGGENPLPMYCAGADKIELKYNTAYDQTATEELQTAMKNYFDGNATLEEAMKTFKTGVKEKHPELSE